MRSKAHFGGEPIHPMLVHFPLAFLLGGFLFDVAGVLGARPEWWEVGGWLVLAGLAAGVVTAIPGVLDYVYTVPPGSSGKRRATKHMVVNVGSLALFGVAALLRGDPAVSPEAVLLGLELAGSGLLLYGGKLGATLVYRNQIGVDHRFAGAGKWREATVGGTAEAVAESGELEPNQMKLIRVGDQRIVLARTETGWVAFDDHCPHRGGSLAGGLLACGTVTCPWHGSQFAVTDGSPTAGPAETGIRTFEVEERDGKVYLSGV